MNQQTEAAKSGSSPASCSPPPISTPSEFLKTPPLPIKIPADWGLELAVSNLTIQLGSKTEAYNRLIHAADKLHSEILENAKADSREE